MLIDSFIFFNEFNILEGRLKYLYDHVDYFILVETDITFSGNPKPYYFRDNMSRYKPYLDKIIYSPFKFDITDNLNFAYKPTTTDYSAPQWKVEAAQRNHLVTAAKIFNDNDLLLISDVDEIPKISTLDYTKTLIGSQVDSIAFGQEMYYYNFRKKQRDYWLGSILTSVRFAKQQSAQWLRNMRSQMPRLGDAGYHLSYWTTPEGIQHKINSFSHQEFNTPTLNNSENILTSITNSEDLFNKKLDLIEVDPTHIDTKIYEIFHKYAISV